MHDLNALSDFRRRCLKKLEGLGDEALGSGDYKKAIEYYKAVEPLIADLEPKHDLLLKRSEAYAELGGPDNLRQALRDADDVS